MDAKAYVKVSVINFSFLIAGALIHPIIVNTFEFLGVVHAQDKKSAPQPEEPQKPPKCDDARYECVTPSISSGSAAFGTILAHRIASDKLTVNGWDLLSLHEATLNTLGRKGLLTAPEIRQIEGSAKAEKPLRVKLPD